MLSTSEIAKAAEIIRDGGLVAFPTETVYGLGADATQDSAVLKIFEAKDRPSDNPLIVHFASLQHVLQYFPGLKDEELSLLEKIKNALTIVLPFNDGCGISKHVCAGGNTIAIRIPKSGIAKKLIKQAGVPIAAPSANISGRPSSTDAEAVYRDLNGRIDALINGKSSDIGIESTVIKVDTNKVVVLRLGGTSISELQKVTTLPVLVSTNVQDTVASPGTRYKHYSPNIPVKVFNKGQQLTTLVHATEETSVYALGMFNVRPWEIELDNSRISVVMVGLGVGAKEIGRNLFRKIRDAEEYLADKPNPIILIEELPQGQKYDAIRERIERMTAE